MFRKKRILVTGGAGFIGSHLCDALLKQNNEVICVDNCFTGSKDNISKFASDKNFEFIRHDITSPLHVEVDEIYNLACPASPIHYQHNPVQTTRTAVHGLINMLELAKRSRIKILQASTSEVYGDPQVHPQPETYFGNVNPFGPRACYDEGKRAGETLLYDYRQQYGVNTRIIRIFNTYGPNMHPNDGRVVSNFIIQALQNHDITIYGDGSQTRSFQYVDDLIRGMIALMNYDEHLEGNVPQELHTPFNIGNPNEFTIRELAEKVIAKTGSSSKIVYMPLPQNDPTRRCPDITKIKNFLGWEPKIMLDEGLDRTIDYFRSVLRGS